MKDFWSRVEKYRELGLDPLKWVAGCAVKVDLTSVVYPALRQIKPILSEMGVTINPREDADIFRTPADGLHIERRIFNLNKPEVNSEDLQKIDPARAVSLVQVHQRKADSPEAFAKALLSIYNLIGQSEVSFTVGKGHSIITAYPDAEFALFDFVSRFDKVTESWTLANNDTIQVIDPTDDPGSEAQTFVAASNSLNDLITLGCFENLQIYPVLDAPTEEMSNQMIDHLKNFSNRYGIAFHDCSRLNMGKLLIGATVVGSTTKELPTFTDALESGMQILVSRAMGDLAPINVYLSCLADDEYLKNLEGKGFSLREVEKAKNDVIATMKQPNLPIGKIINQHCPFFGEDYDPGRHIADTGDVSGPGIYIFKEMAELAKVDIILEQVPLVYPEYVHFASANYLIDNATAGTNGAIAIVGSKEVVESVSQDLKREGYKPEIIGKVLGKGQGKVYVPESVTEMISSKAILSEFELGKHEGTN